MNAHLDDLDVFTSNYTELVRDSGSPAVSFQFFREGSSVTLYEVYENANDLDTQLALNDWKGFQTWYTDPVPEPSPPVEPYAPLQQAFRDFNTIWLA